MNGTTTRSLSVLVLALLVACGDDGSAGSTSAAGSSDDVATQGESASESASSSGESEASSSGSSGSTESSESASSESSESASSESSETSASESSESSETGVSGCAGACGSPGCGPCPDAPSVDVPGGYAIGSTEVTHGHYAQFLAEQFEPGFVAGWLPSGCAFKTDFTPAMWDDNDPAELPVVQVDWCDAWAYCAWSGQQLCGAIGGGPTPLDQLDNPAMSQWVRACTGGGLSIYPYGVSYEADACNGMDAGFGQLVDAGSLLGCEGGFAGIFDMSGNVWEWENACDDNPNLPGNEQPCQVRGGSYFSIDTNLRCSTDIEQTRDFRNHHTGIRCCG
jgi:hypothetical protein